MHASPMHASPMHASPMHSGSARSGLDQVVNRTNPAVAAHAAGVRPQAGHLNRGTRRSEVGTRRTDDTRLSQSRTALED